MFNSLDARAVTQPGGFADSLKDAIVAAIQGHGQSLDRVDQRAGEMARLAIDDRRREEMEQRDDTQLQHSLARDGAYTGSDPGMIRINADALESGALERELRRSHKARLDSEARENLMNGGANLFRSVAGPVSSMLGIEYNDGRYKFPRSMIEKPITQNMGDNITPNIKQWDASRGVWVNPPMEDGGTAAPTTVRPSEGASAAVKRYYEGGWFGAGKDDAAGLETFDPAQVEAAARAGGYDTTRLPRAGQPGSAMPATPAQSGNGPAAGRQQQPTGARAPMFEDTKAQELAAGSMAKRQAEAQHLPPERSGLYLQKQQELHQRWLEAVRSGDSDMVTKLNTLIVRLADSQARPTPSRN